MTVSLSHEQRVMLGDCLCNIPEFQDTHARWVLLRACLAVTPEGEKLVQHLVNQGSAAVFASDVIDRLANAAALEDGQQPLYLFLARLDQRGYLNDAACKAFRALCDRPDLSAAGPDPQPAAVAVAPSTLSMTPERHDRLKALLEALFKGMDAAARKAFVRDALGRGHEALNDIPEVAWGQTPSVAADAVADAFNRHRHLPTPHGDDPIAAISRLVRAKKLDGNPDIRPHLEPVGTGPFVAKGARLLLIGGTLAGVLLTLAYTLQFWYPSGGEPLPPTQFPLVIFPPTEGILDEPGITVHIDGRLVGSFGTYMVAPGDHEVLVSNPRHGEYREVVNVNTRLVVVPTYKQ